MKKFLLCSPIDLQQKAINSAFIFAATNRLSHFGQSAHGRVVQAINILNSRINNQTLPSMSTSLDLFIFSNIIALVQSWFCKEHIKQEHASQRIGVSHQSYCGHYNRSIEEGFIFGLTHPNQLFKRK